MSCVYLDRDHIFTIHDFRPTGFVGNVTVNLTHGFQPGAFIGAVLLSKANILMINIYDGGKNCVLRIVERFADGQLILNTNINGQWGAYEIASKNPIVKGVRATVSLVYESDGYRIIVNGESLHFFKHRSTTKPIYPEIKDGQVFKTGYYTTIDIIS